MEIAENSNKRLVVVLGMHRSGTSPITKSLELMGVGLGTELHPAGFDNPRGFWEDRECIEINDRLLRHLGSAYDRLGLAWDEVRTDSQVSELKLRAVQLISSRLVENGGVWGFKDPRTCRLFGFWNEVFLSLVCEVSFVIAVRNPASVAASLMARNSIAAEKVYFLWLQHVLAALSFTKGARWVVVDYDELLVNPYSQIVRISSKLGLPLPDRQSSLVRDFENNFLERGLRHTSFTEAELALDSRAPRMVTATYNLLHRLAKDQAALESSGVQDALNELNARLRETSPAFDYINVLEDERMGLWQAAAARDGQIVSLNQAAAERDGQIAILHQTVGKRDGQIVSLNQAVADRDGQIVSLNQAAAERDGQIASLHQTVGKRDGQIVSLNQAVADRDGQIVSLNQAVADRDGQIVSLNQAVADRDGQIVSLNQAVADRDGQIVSLNQAAAERDGQIASLHQTVGERDGQIVSLNQAVADRDGQIVSLNQAVADRDGQIGNLKQAVAERDGQIRNLSVTISEIFSSTSWKVTLPLRLTKKCFQYIPRLPRHAAGLIEDCIRFIYHQLPGSGHARRNVKGILFENVPFIFKGSKAYQAWASLYTSGVKVQPQITAYLDAAPKQCFDNTPDEYIRYRETPPPISSVKLLAFYLPQFHPIPENDLWWGKGFTEWANVTRATAQFQGHYQPHLPGELGFYDLRLIENQVRQIELARIYGISGFCYHYYWFGGKRLLERPLNQVLGNKEINFPFCICWANENWSRRWDGCDEDILVAQDYSPGYDLAFIRDLEPVLKDARYIRINNRPLIIVYRAELLPESIKTAECWRNYCRESGIGEIYLASTHSFEKRDPRDLGFDAAIEFPPNNTQPPTITHEMQLLNAEHRGIVYDYRFFTEQSRNYVKPPYKLFRGVFPTWDNEARKPGRGSTFHHSSPNAYSEWLENACKDTIERFDGDERIVFINAWNEWAEGCHL